MVRYVMAGSLAFPGTSAGLKRHGVIGQGGYLPTFVSLARD